MNYNITYILNSFSNSISQGIFIIIMVIKINKCTLFIIIMVQGLEVMIKLHN